MYKYSLVTSMCIAVSASNAVRRRELFNDSAGGVATKSSNVVYVSISFAIIAGSDGVRKLSWRPSSPSQNCESSALRFLRWDIAGHSQVT